MTTTGEVHVGDVGTTYRAAIQDAGEAFNPTAATSKHLIFKTPAGVLVRDATVSFEEPNWVMSYTLVSPTDDAFHGRAGVYRWQGHVVFAGGQQFHTNVESYRVVANLD